MYTVAVEFRHHVWVESRKMGLGRQIGEGAVAARGEVASGADTEAAVSSRQMGQVASEVV